MTSVMRLALFFAVVSGLAPSAPGQLPACPPHLQVGFHLREWSGRSLHPGLCRDMVRARLTGTGYADLVFLAGPDPILVVAPAMVNQIVALPGASRVEAREICLVEGSGQSDRIAMLTDEGLHLWDYDQASGAGSMTRLTSPAWRQTSRLCSVRGADQLAAIAPARDEVWLVDHAGITQSFAPGPAIHHIEAVDWDADGVDELAVAMATGLGVYELDGTNLIYWGLPTTAAFGVRMSTPLGEVVALVCTIYGWQWLLTIGNGFHGGTVLSGDVVSIGAGSSNPGGWDELALGYAGRSDVGVLLNTGLPSEQFRFTPGGGVNVQFPTVPGVAGNGATPNLGDFDGDGLGDLAYPCEGSPHIAFGLSPFATTLSPTPRYVGINYTSGSGPSSGGTDRITVLLDPSTAVPAGATDVEMISWYATTTGGELRTLAGRVDVQRSPTLGGVMPVDVDTFCVPGMLNIDALLMMLRFVEVGEAGKVVRAWPPVFAMSTVHSNILTLAGHMPGFEVVPGGLGGAATGGVADVKLLPPPSDDSDAAPVVVH